MAQNEGHCPERFELGVAYRDLELDVDRCCTSILRLTSAFRASSVGLTSTVLDPPQPVAPGKMANRQARITAQSRACLKNPASARQTMISPLGSAGSVRRPGVFFVRDAALCRQESRCRRSGRKCQASGLRAPVSISARPCSDAPTPGPIVPSRPSWYRSSRAERYPDGCW